MSWRPDSPTELSDGKLVCKAHQLKICGKCCVDYSFMDEIDDDDDDQAEESDGDELLTEEEMKAFRERLIRTKGCACFLPIVGNGCKNCDVEMKKNKTGEEGGSKAAKTTRENTKKKSQSEPEKSVRGGQSKSGKK